MQDDVGLQIARYYIYGLKLRNTEEFSRNVWPPPAFSLFNSSLRTSEIRKNDEKEGIICLRLLFRNALK